MKKTLTVMMMVLMAMMMFVSCDNKVKEPETKTYKVGDEGPAGGIIFYDAGSTQTSTYKDKDGNDVTYKWRYLEAARADLASKYVFGYYRTGESDSNATVGTATGIGTGKANTEALVNAMGDKTYSKASGTDKAEYAAKACADYGNNTAYDDWFLPSKDELIEMYKNKDKIGSFVNYYYWSSSENSSSMACDHSFSGGYPTQYTRDTEYRVRPIRAF